jgi:hypothetical protein
MKRKRNKRIIFEVSNEHWVWIHREAKIQNITIRALVLRILLPELLK